MALDMCICYLSFPYFVTATLRMCAGYRIRRPFPWPACFSSAFRIRAAGEMWAIQALALRSVDSVQSGWKCGRDTERIERKRKICGQIVPLQRGCSTFQRNKSMRAVYRMMVLVAIDLLVSLLVWLVLVRVAVAGAGRRCIALIVEKNVIGWRRARRYAATITLQFQV